MSQDTHITTFQFLEEIQSAFLSANKAASESSNSLDTRRIVNFFENTAKLHILKSDDAIQLNGSASPIAILSIQSVAKDGEVSTFSINIQVNFSDKQKKLLMLVQDEASMKIESKNIVKLLNASLEESSKAVVEAPIAEESRISSTSRSSSLDTGSSDDSSRDRLSRRSRLRGRDES